jgi:CPA2 family monovalent cation:H+ antiporter-2
VRRIAVPGAVVQIGVATGLGMGRWPALGAGAGGAGWCSAVALSVASTVVLLRALEARGMLETMNGRIAVGWLVVEDLAMVLVLVLLPALAGDAGGQPARDSRGPPAHSGLTLGHHPGKVGGLRR